MTNKTKAQIQNELESRTRYAKQLEADLKICNSKVQQLEREKVQKAKGWKLKISEQTLTGDYAQLRKSATLLLENGFWFMYLYQE